MASEVEARARAWIAHDPDPGTRAEALALIERGDLAALAACFGPLPTFGTAGLRAPLGPGPSRMNRATVRRIAAAVAGAVAGLDGPVVIGADGRRGSAAFAEDAARVLTGAGIEVFRFDGVVPTPLLAFAVRGLRARAGVMVTASHNPPGDNGIKVYGPDGAQIVAPLDGEIALRLAGSGPVGDDALGGLPRPVPAEILDCYVAEVLALRVHQPERRVRIAYTPLHGVGAATVRRVLSEAGYDDVHVVPEQAEPDGAFPTVAFPNPEEPGALDLLIRLAEAVDAPVALANDPDADRIAVAVRCADGTYRALTGNEIGTLLAEDLLAHGSDGPRLVATTVVSSSLLPKIAAAHGAECALTWTGFKWIARAAASSSARFVLGYEEALGVCAGEVVRDKDGVSAALLVADLASHLAGQGRTLIDAIDDLHRAHGVHLGAAVTVTLPGAEGLRRIAAAMAGLRAEPPREIGGLAVSRWVDHQVTHPPTLPPADLLSAELQGGARALFRPSGTEPKLKAYLEIVQPIGEGGLPEARRAARERLDLLAAAVRRQLDARTA